MGLSLFAKVLNCWTTVQCFLPEAVGAPASQAVVDLGYSKYIGTQLQNGITEWLGIRCLDAAPPLGDLRFAAPEDPVYEKYVQLASIDRPACLTAYATKSTPFYSEDCLFMNVWAPTGKKSASLPVYFFVQGGGFEGNANANYNASGLIEATNLDMVVVTFNYRVGPFGFLASKEIQQEASLNNGLKDQFKALEWVQKYIHLFGGNPKHVVLGGVSAGGGSAAILLTAHGGRNDDLFQAALIESPTFNEILNVEQSQYQYDGLVTHAGCNGQSDTLACLRSVSSQTLQGYNIEQANEVTIASGQHFIADFIYGPTLDGDILQDYTYNSFSQGKFIRVPTMWGDDKNGATVFTQPNISTQAQSNDFLKSQFSTLTESQMERIAELYPISDFPTQFADPNAGKYYRQAAKAFGDMWFMCPEIYATESYANDASVSVWNYLWNVRDPTYIKDGLGVPHLEELAAVWGTANIPEKIVPKSFLPGQSNAAIIPVTQAYWTSFMRSFDPNTYRDPESPEWTAWTPSSKERLMFKTNETHMAVLSEQRMMRCSYLSSIGPSLRQ